MKGDLLKRLVRQSSRAFRCQVKGLVSEMRTTEQIPGMVDM